MRTGGRWREQSASLGETSRINAAASPSLSDLGNRGVWEESMAQPTNVDGITGLKSRKPSASLEMSFSYCFSNIPQSFLWYLDSPSRRAQES